MIIVKYIYIEILQEKMLGICTFDLLYSIYSITTYRLHLGDLAECLTFYLVAKWSKLGCADAQPQF